MQGQIRIYTGKGKGKTTSALGHTVRAVGSGKTVFIGQFLKSGKYSEIAALKQFPDQITVEHYGLGKFVKNRPSPEDVEAGISGYKKIKAVLENGRHDLVVMDEGNIAVKYGIISEQDLLTLFDMKPDHVELVVTGRGASQTLIDRADHVVELNEIKHYFKQGVKARVGIEK